MYQRALPLPYVVGGFTYFYYHREVVPVAEKKINDVIDVRTWQPFALKWETLPPDYVAAYLKHQFGLALPKEQRGETFKEMFELSSADGRRFLAQTVGVINPFAKKGNVIKYTDVQREQISRHLIEHAKLEYILTQFFRLNGNHTAILRRIDKDVATKIVELLVRDAGPVAHLVAFLQNDGEEEESRYAMFLRLVEENPELSAPIKVMVLETVKQLSTNDLLDSWLGQYAKAQKIKVEGEIAEVNPWEPTWRDLYQRLRAVPIKDPKPPQDPEWVDE